MMGGDISNDSPSLVMVHVDVFAPKKTEDTRRLFGLLRDYKWERRVNLRTINALYRNSLTFRGVTLECFDTDPDDKYAQNQLGSVEEYLDVKGLNPFRSFRMYDGVQAVVDEMAYLPRLLGVVDVPERGMRYGSKFMPSSRLLGNSLGG